MNKYKEILEQTLKSASDLTEKNINVPLLVDKILKMVEKEISGMDMNKSIIHLEKIRKLLDSKLEKNIGNLAMEL